MNDFQLILTKPNGDMYDITSIVSTMSNSGNYKQCARNLSVTVIKSEYDKLLSVLDINEGDLVTLYVVDNGDKLEMYRGIVFSIECDRKSDVMEFNSYDAGIYLKKNEVNYNFKDSDTQKHIITTVCNDLGIDINEAAFDDVKGIGKAILSETAYDVIMDACFSAYGNEIGEQCYILFRNGRLNIFKCGETSYVQFEEKYNLTGSKRIISIDDMINRVIITDKDGSKMQEFKNESNMKKFGQFQVIKSNEDGINGASYLNGVSDKLEVEGIGDLHCIVGKKIKIIDSSLNVNDDYFILEDEHNWSNGMYITKLVLSKEFKQDKPVIFEKDNEIIELWSNSNINTGGNINDGTISLEGFLHIKREEGFAPYPFDVEGQGMVTGGYGTHSHYQKKYFNQLGSSPINESTASEILFTMIVNEFGKPLIRDLKSKGVNINNIKTYEFDMMVSLGFNYGLGGIRKHNWYKALINGESSSSIASKISSLTSNKNRRKREGEIYRTGNYNSSKAINKYNSSGRISGNITDNNGRGHIPSYYNSSTNTSSNPGSYEGGKWMHPTSNKRLTSPFGMRNGRMHKGNDYGAIKAGVDGDKIYASEGGTVTHAGSTGNAYGTLIKIQHNDRYESRYAHLQKVLVRKGETVSRGQVIGYMGGTNDSGKRYATHLHFEIRENGDAKDTRKYTG